MVGTAPPPPQTFAASLGLVAGAGAAPGGTGAAGAALAAEPAAAIPAAAAAAPARAGGRQGTRSDARQSDLGTDLDVLYFSSSKLGSVLVLVGQGHPMAGKWYLPVIGGSCFGPWTPLVFLNLGSVLVLLVFFK